MNAKDVYLNVKKLEYYYDIDFELDVDVCVCVKIVKKKKVENVIVIFGIQQRNDDGLWT